MSEAGGTEGQTASQNHFNLEKLGKFLSSYAKIRAIEISKQVSRVIFDEIIRLCPPFSPIFWPVPICVCHSMDAAGIPQILHILN